MKNGQYDIMVAPLEYPGKKYKGRYCRMHYFVWWKNNGMLPGEGEIIHHKDGNSHNNDIKNLKLMTNREHAILHSSAQACRMVELRCPHCDKVFVRPRRQTHLTKGRGALTFCSRDCSRRMGRYKQRSTKAQILELQRKNVIREYIERDRKE